MENLTQQDKTNAGQGMGIASLVTGILGVVTSFIPCFGFFAMIFGVLAIVFGVVGLNQAKKGNGKTGMPMAGLILGIIASAFIVIWLIVFAGVLATGAASSISS
ncbi:MAG TPA: hypothetical protein DCE81_03720 [Cytophagales bacterium]|nr:hypothetical protein [Cytophagales bacterium]